MTDSECTHQYEKTGFCEWETNGKVKKQDIFECKICSHRKEVFK